MKTKSRILLFIYSATVLLAAAWFSYNAIKKGNERAVVMNDYALANSIEYGLLSATVWKEKVVDIIQLQIEQFELNEEQDSLLKIEVSQLLHKMIDEAESQVNSNKKGFKNRLRRLVVNVLVDWDEVRNQVPQFTQTIVREITSDKSKERLKSLAISKVNEYADQVYDDTVTVILDSLYAMHGVTGHEQFNSTLLAKADQHLGEAFTCAYWVILCALLSLLPWLLAWRFKLNHLYRSLFASGVVMCLILLVAGLAAPMIEIDARIREIDFMLLGEHVIFTDQMLFYRSKSIIEVVQVLLTTHSADAVFVGILKLLFSVVMPIGKLVATQLVISGVKPKGFLRWMVYKSGKWSMADVMVVAIFMSYVGFNGILNDQLATLEMHEQTLTSIATNLTSLQPGFILFLFFVLYSLFISHRLKQAHRTLFTE
ncbi:MAG: hypothetical protein Kow0075_11110 [Salibacteraceae bacterium]